MSRSLNKPAAAVISIGVSADERLREIETLYRNRYAHFLRVALLVVGDRERAVEAVHDGFADAIRSRRGFLGRGPLEAWVWRAVVNAARRARRQATPLPLDADAVARRNGYEERAPEWLRGVIAALPERERLALYLRYYADLDYDAIATAMGVRKGTVSATLHAAHAALRQALEEEDRDRA